MSPAKHRAVPGAVALGVIASTLALPGCTSTDVTFCREESCTQKVVDEIDNASQTVHTAIYALTNDDIVGALTEAAGRGIEVKLVAEPSQTDGTVMSRLYTGGVDVRYAEKRACSCTGAQGIMHHKFTVVDSRIVLSGSFNYSCSAESCNDENVMMVIDPRIAERFEGEFSYLFEVGDPI